MEDQQTAYFSERELEILALIRRHIVICEPEGQPWGYTCVTDGFDAILFMMGFERHEEGLHQFQSEEELINRIKTYEAIKLGVNDIDVLTKLQEMIYEYSDFPSFLIEINFIKPAAIADNYIQTILDVLASCAN